MIYVKWWLQESGFTSADEVSRCFEPCYTECPPSEACKSQTQGYGNTSTVALWSSSGCNGMSAGLQRSGTRSVLTHATDTYFVDALPLVSGCNGTTAFLQQDGPQALLTNTGNPDRGFGAQFAPRLHAAASSVPQDDTVECRTFGMNFDIKLRNSSWCSFTYSYLRVICVGLFFHN